MKAAKARYLAFMAPIYNPEVGLNALDPWSSYRRYVGIGSQFDWLDIDPCFEGLGNCDDERAIRYREFVQSAIPAGEWALIREALQRGQLTGTERFCDEIETIIGRRIENRKQGRPRKDTQK
jgi:putative transposase